ncbi:MAG: M20/M25/M40 family metallo-hydrolase [Candidatus Marinimicrobia bacterium]|nr:M20/M25/M40 family metallo-hydrolase [Candidatus Neomarinimicrobiota bacterium]
MKVAIIYNRDFSKVINKFGMQNKEKYSPETVKAVAKALEDGGHNVNIIDGNMHMIEELQEFMPKVVEGERMGLVFNMAYGIQGESRYTHIPSILEMLGIPYVGSTPAGHALALDKVNTKILWQKYNIPTPNFWVFNSADEDMSTVEFPVIVKPKMESVSFGLRIVHNIEDLRKAVDFIVNEYLQQALVEQFIAGREFCVGLLGNNPVEAFPVLEIDLENDPNAIQTMDNKKSKPRAKICPANISNDLTKKMQQISKDAFNALHLRDFARVDIRLSEEGRIYLLEINSMASLGRTGSYLKAAQSVGYDFSSLVNKMLDVASNRYFTNYFTEEGAAFYTTKFPLRTRISGYLRSQQIMTEKFLSKIVNKNSYVRNVEGVNEIGQMVIKEFTHLGFFQKIFPRIEVGNIVLLSNTPDFQYDFLFLTHLDNSEKLSQQDYFKLTEQKLFGTGIWENKGGLAILVSALKALKYTRKLQKKKIGVLITSDDNLKGKFAQELIIEISQNAKYIIGLKGAFLDGGLVTTRSGAAVYRCEMKLSDTSCAENVPIAQGIFLQFLKKCVGLTDIQKGFVVTINKNTMESNINNHYAHAEVQMSIRYQVANDIEEFDKSIRSFISSKNLKKVDFQIKKQESRPALVSSKTNEDFWLKIKSISNQLDIRLLEEHRWSSSDIGFADHTKPAIDGLGPIGAKPQQNPEYILRHSLLERALLLAMIINDVN